MTTEHYDRFVEYTKKGLGKEATKPVRAFIESFGSQAEAEPWVWAFLSGIDERNLKDQKIRHERLVGRAMDVRVVRC